jgi:membrane-associated protease RseP (regulator of RpoE activity)
VALLVLFYGFYNLPPADYIFNIHPEYKQYGLDYAKTVYQKSDSIVDVTIGKNLLFLFFEHFVADPSRMPNPHEIMHYPYLFAGFLALVFTFLNLMPIGQLDGGHVLYGLVGYKKHRVIASVIFLAFMFYAGLGNGYIDPLDATNLYLPFTIIAYIIFLYIAFLALKLSKRDTIMCAVVMFGVQFLIAKFFPTIKGFDSWAIFGFIISRFVGIQHPRCEIEEPLDTKRIVLGWLALLIFVLCFSPAPLVVK